MAESRPETRDRLAIIAGGGMLPRYVADAARARGESPYILSLRDESAEDWSGYDHETVSIGNYAGIGAAIGGVGNRTIGKRTIINARSAFGPAPTVWPDVALPPQPAVPELPSRTAH